MLAPEVVFFEAPKVTEKRAKLSTTTECIGENGCFKFDKNDYHEPAVIRNLKIVLPSMLHPPSELKAALTSDTQFYRATNISIASVIFSKDFAKTFVAQGSVFLQSYIEDISRDDGIIILPSGKLILLLDRPTSQTLALEGFHVLTIGKDRILASVDLTKTLEPSKGISTKVVHRWRKSLSNIGHLLTEPITFTWQPHDDCICPSTIARYFHDSGAIVEEVGATIILKRRELSPQQIPRLCNFSESTFVFDENDVDFEGLEGWIGGMLYELSKQQLEALAEAASTDSLQMKSRQESTQTLVVEAKGLYLAQSLNVILATISNVLATKAEIPWIAVTMEPSVASLHLPQSNGNVQLFSVASRTLLVCRNAVVVRSKRAASA